MDIRRFVFFAMIIAVMFTAVCGCGSMAVRDVDMQILFINVGKADSALITLGDKRYLIDTGSADSLPALVKALRAQNVKTLEGVFLSHTHEDHTGGLHGLLQLFDVKQIYASEITQNKKNGGNVVDDIAFASGKSVRRLKLNENVTPDSAFPDVAFTVAGPSEYNTDDDNDNSLVLYLTDGAFTCLFTGDMQFAEEQALLKAATLKPCTVLKVANHGNPDATSKEFISVVKPQYAVISTNSSVDQDTPSPNVVNELQGIGAKVFVTQDTKTGIRAVVHDGKAILDAYNAEESKAPEGLTIESVDKKAERLVMRNTGKQAIDLSKGWIFSDGGEMFVFPENTVIQPGKTLSITSGKDKDGDLYWDEKNVWNDKKKDTVVICDSMGNELIRQDL